MRAPAQWWLEKPDWQARLLQPLGMIYGLITAMRMKRRGTHVDAPVICIGNFIAGGAGKTPTALAIGKMMKDKGESVAFLSRGFGGALSCAEPLKVDPLLHQARDVGDEPLLLARLAPTFICTDRVAGARAAAENGATLIIMDDGLQNPSLAKELSLAVVDGEAGIGNGLCIPAGPLRAPMHEQWPHVDALVIIGEGAAGERVALEAGAHGKPVFRADLVPQDVEKIRGRRVYAFAGIGRPKKFFRSLRENGAILSVMQAFDDHHPYSAQELDKIRKLSCEGEDYGDLIVTTEKDAARIPAGALPGLFVLRVELAFDNAQALASLIAKKISRG